MKHIYKRINLLFVVIIILICSHSVSAQYAIGGTAGNLVKSVYWLTWDATTLVSKPAGFSSTKIVAGEYIWKYSESARITAVVSNLTVTGGGTDIKPYTPGDYSGDGLDLIYSSNNLPKTASRGVPNSGLSIASQTAKFDIAVKVELLANNVWTAVDYPGMIIGDAESVDGNGEYFQATTPGVDGWHLLNKHTNSNSPAGNDAYVATLSDAGKTFRVRVNSGPGNLGVQAVMYAHRVKSLNNVTMKGSGTTAIALGFVLPFDLGDAPISYGDKVAHYIDDFTFTPLPIGVSGVDYPIVSANESSIVPKAKVYIGSSNVDADGQGGHSVNADIDNNTENNDEETINTATLGDIKVNQDGDYVIGPFNVTNTKGVPATLYSWLDFDGDGKFSADELITVTVPANSTNFPVTVTYPNAAFTNKVKIGPLYGRLRITTTDLTDDPLTTGLDERSVYTAVDGETEDYKFKNVLGVTVSGNVVNDGDGINGGLAGNGVGVLGGSQLYAYLVDEISNNIVAKVSVNADGTYSFTNSVNKGNYTVAISTVSATLGANISSIPATLPVGWTAVGEEFGINNSQTGIEPGIPDMRIKIVIPNTSLDITQLNFAIDQNPVAVDDSPPTATPINTSLLVDILANDTDPNGNATINKTTVKLIDPADNTEKSTVTTTEGIYTVDAITGKVTFKPVATFVGITGSTAGTTIKYIVLDDAGVKSNQGTLVIKVKPVGVTDNSSTVVDVPVTTTVKTNDGPSGIGTVVVKVTDPVNGGSITINGAGEVEYTPASGYVGSDSYTYKLVTADGVESDPITVNVTIGLSTNTISGNVFNDTNGLNGIPVNTVDGSAYTLANLNVVVYNNTTGKVEAISAVSALGTYSVPVTKDDDYTLYLTTNSATVGDAAIPVIALPSGWVNTGESTSASAESDGTPNSILPIGIVSANIGDRNFGIEQFPTAVGSGSNTVNNPGGTAQVNVPANTFTNTSISEDPTLVTGIRITGFPTNTTTIVINGTSYGAADLAALTALIIPTDASGNPTQTINIDPSATGNSVISFKAVDAAGKESTGIGTATLSILNIPPTTDDITNASIPSNQPTPVDINNPTGADIDGTVVSYKIASIPTSGTLYKADGVTAIALNDVLTVAEANGLRFKPSGTSNVSVTFTIAAIDNDGAEDATPATFTIPLSNTPPVAVDNLATTLEDVPVILTAIQNNDTDNDGTVVSSTIDLDPSTPDQQTTFTNSDGTWVLTPATGDVLFTPVLNFNGTSSIKYTIKDNDGATSNEANLSIEVTAVNKAPIAVANTNTVLEDNTLAVSANAAGVIGGVLVNDKDADNDPLIVSGFTVTGVTGVPTLGTPFTIPAVGDITLNADGSYVFVPLLNYNGTVPTINYSISDGNGGTASSTLIITVAPVNDVPSFTKGADQVVAINTTAQTIPAWATALSKGPADETTQVLDFVVTNDNNALFSVQPFIGANGTLSYTPATGKFGKTTVTVKLHDNGGTSNGGVDLSGPQTFIISIKPVGVDDNDLTPINTPTTTLVTTNDGASGIGTTVIPGGTNPSHGTIVINPDNTITYTPAADYLGADTYTYVLETADGVKSDPITVNINVYKAAITLAKEGAYFDFDTNGKVNVGDRINYTFVVKNTGSVAVTGIVLSDENATMNAGGPISLAAGASDNTTFTGYHVLTQADIDNGGVFNLATANGKDPKDKDVTITSEDPTPLAPGDPNYPVTPPTPVCPTCTVTSIEQQGSIALIKAVTNSGTGENGTFILGNTIQYTFTVTNTGNLTLKNVTLEDVKLGGGKISVTGTLLPGAVTTVVRNYTITELDIAEGNVTNTATVKAETPTGKEVTDESGSTNSNDMPTVTKLGKPPVASNDVAVTLQNNPVQISIQTNDVAGSSPIVVASVTITVQPLHGVVTVNSDGTVTYEPTDGYVGNDTFNYTVKDSNGQTSNQALVSIQIKASVPVAKNDNASTTYSKLVTIPVVNNDVKDVAPLDLTTVVIVDQPLNGTVRTNSDGTIDYTPNDGYTGTDTFTYRLKDSYGNYTNVATVTVSVEGLFIPNVITPNGDGKNDVWVIVGANNYDKVEVEIFNRWGNQVYINKDYRNNWSGEHLNEGTYYYVARLYKGGTSTIHKGWVLIKRS